MTGLFDPKCADLARYFLSDLAPENLVSELAVEIQQTVESWIEHARIKSYEQARSRTLPV